MVEIATWFVAGLIIGWAWGESRRLRDARAHLRMVEDLALVVERQLAGARPTGAGGSAHG